MNIKQLKIEAGHPCPACDGERTYRIPDSVTDKLDTIDVPLDFCIDCRVMWERIPDGEQYLQDGDPVSFAEPCDNCAFRPGSIEQTETPDEWREIMRTLHAGGQFFCHKAVPISERAGVAFEYPLDAEGNFDKQRMRFCRGYLIAWRKWMDSQMRKGGTDEK